jgi:hypothetical protein
MLLSKWTAPTRTAWKMNQFDEPSLRDNQKLSRNPKGLVSSARFVSLWSVQATGTTGLLRFDWETAGGDVDVGKETKVEGSRCLRQVAVEVGAGQQEGCEDGSASEQKETGA